MVVTRLRLRDFRTYDAAEIAGIAKLQALSQTDQFTQAAAQAAATPLNVAQDLVKDPVQTISSVPRGIWGFLNQAGEAVKQVADGEGGGLGGVVARAGVLRARGGAAPVNHGVYLGGSGDVRSGSGHALGARGVA